MKMHRRLATAAALSLALGACATAMPAPETTAPAVPRTWTNGALAGAAEPAAARAVPDRWWETYGAVGLADLIARAERNNADLAASRQRIAQARAQARAAGAGLLPTLNTSGGASRSAPGEGRGSNSFRGAFDASYEVDFWGGNRARAEAAEASAAGVRYDQDAAVLSLRAEVARTYFQLLNLNDRLANARRILTIAEDVLGLVETQESLGAASGLEVSRQRGAVASLRANIPSLEQSRAETLNALALLLGTTPGAVILRADTLDDVHLPAVTPGLPSDLLLRRPDLRAAEASMTAADADLRAARAAMLPSIRLTGGGGFTSAELSSLFSPAGFLANLASGVAAPLFDGGRLAAQRDAATAAGAAAAEAYRGAVLSAFRDVEDALAATSHLADVETARREAFEEAEQSYRIAEARYRAGRTDFLDLLDAQRTLFQQEDQLEQVRLARLNASVALYKALGGGWCEGGNCGGHRVA
ncbi:putative outer membrane protein [Caenispirillum salinarum AK4]|uniref:Putative outer membrane protein n=1 Tax=Caenispirillum salinarum AK4 TaxID=1238182 RepID=K9HML6_9PROT|nr:efflux transporter outer membrane subunit [Caenispirillum salinarum]EKV29781.1 putative outer membrane protein [Caenispirillum salinarum AK4]